MYNVQGFNLIDIVKHIQTNFERFKIMPIFLAFGRYWMDSLIPNYPHLVYMYFANILGGLF